MGLERALDLATGRIAEIEAKAHAARALGNQQQAAFKAALQGILKDAGIFELFAKTETQMLQHRASIDQQMVALGQEHRAALMALEMLQAPEPPEEPKKPRARKRTTRKKAEGKQANGNKAKTE